MKFIQNPKNILLFAFALFAIIFLTNFQNNSKPMLNINNGDYANYWKIIDSLDQKGLPKSALEKVLELYEIAKKEENPSQIIKTLIYRGKYESQLEEDGLVNAIFKMEQEMESEAFPVKPILQSMLAEMYQNYLNQNRWRFQNRTTPVAFENQDIRTWTIDQLIEKSGELYLASVETEKSQQIKINDFDAILKKGQNDDNLRPTLYDFLAHRAIDYFMNEQSHLVQPANKFSMNLEAYFTNYKDFVKLRFRVADAESYKFKAFELFQKLLAFRENDLMMHYGNPELIPALIDADLKRMKFVFDNSILDTKFEIYVKELEKMVTYYENLNYDKTKDNHIASEIKFAVANAYFQKGQSYQPTPNEENPEKHYWKKAHEIAKSVTENDKESFGAKQCLSLIKQIETKSLSLQLEQVNLPNQPFLALVNYRNVPKIHAKVIRMNTERINKFEEARQQAQKKRENQILFDYINSLPTVEQSNFELPKDDDFRQHSTEINFKGLEGGEYLVVVANNSQFKISVGAAGYAFTKVSEIGFWHRKNNEGRDEYTVFNRKTGKPLTNVEASFATYSYNSITRRNELSKKSIKVSTDKNGFVIAPDMPNSGRNRNPQFQVSFKNGKDTLSLDDRYHQYRSNNRNRKYQTTHFFLDRAIYRPNQTVYFKGIALEMNEERMPSILSNQKVRVTFRDANYQEVAFLDLTTNEYGTFNGNFTTPNSGLLGQMFIQSSIGGQQKNFRVEEYKRPKFEVNFEPIEGSFKFDELVEVTGHAKAFAGNNIDGAKVKYRVVREVKFPWMPYWYWRRGYNPYAREAQEIASGETISDAEGKFKIEFTALPDRSIPAEKKPEFSYRVEADVVDISGETHSNSTAVKVGYVALQIGLPMASEILSDSLHKIEISTKNLNGEFEAASGKFVLQKLKTPNNFFLDRYWQQPEYQLISEANFNKDFPNFAYKNENEVQNWAVENTILDTNFDTKNQKEVLMPKAGLSAGQYVAIIESKDKFGTAVELKKYFEVFDLNDKKLATPAILFHHFDNKKYEPKDLAEIYFRTSEKEQPILFEIEKDQKIVSRNWLTVSNLYKQMQPIEESDRGNIFYHFSYAKKNRSQNQTHTIQIPWSNKELSFEYSTFRDKLQPGQKEEWTIKIKGPKGEKVAAEMVAGMYDASLDEFAVNNWGLNLFPMNYARKAWSKKGFNEANFRFYKGWNRNYGGVSRSYDYLNWFGFGFHQRRFRTISRMSRSRSSNEMMTMSAAPMEMEEAAMSFDADSDMTVAAGVVMKKESLTAEDIANLPTKDVNAIAASAAGVSSESEQDFSQIKVRTNLNETVFFYPNLMTDKAGNVLIKFTMNEALTKWKFLGLAHTKDLKIGTTSKEIVTQKDLMVVPNPPRFFRERDEIEFTAKVVNLSDKTLTGNAKLNLDNPITTKAIFDQKFESEFTVEAGQSIPLSWRFKVPDVTDVSLIQHTVLAMAGDFSDAEQSVAPVLSNRMLVTETKPLSVRENSSKTFTLESLQNANSESLTHHSMTLEFTSNPAWYAVQALPYLMEYPYECTEQIFSRYYANSLATTVANSHPKVKAVFDKWRDYEQQALESNLSKNQELKSALLEETPWVLAAQSEEQQKKNIALLFDLNRMSNEQEIALSKMQKRQLANGGWSWFPGGRDSWYISQYLVEGFGHLNKLGVKDITENQQTWNMVRKAVRYIDDEIVRDYEKYVEGKDGKDDHLSSIRIHYLYARSFFLESQNSQANLNQNDRRKPKNYIALEGKAKQVFDYYLKQAEAFWLKKGLYHEGMLALALHRMNKAESAADIIKSLKERSLNNEEMGMYWKYNTGYYWYQLPIETHALMIEVFEEVAQDERAVNDLKVWLLKNKQTNHWKTTKATSAAVYALLMNGSQWLTEDTPLQISFPKAKDATVYKQVLEAQKSAQAGTGYFKTNIAAADISKDLATIEVKNENEVPAWGAMYWQYFEDLDKIKTFEETPLTLKKELFLVKNSDNGEVLKVAENEQLIPGDKLKVRIELRVDRDMEYVHMKDMRASGFEPINVLSSYKWQDGLGYYESTRDASTNFFFSRLPKGTYVFEYPLRVIHKGDFSNGVTTIQSMYAPEFSSHSEGVRVEVK